MLPREHSEKVRSDYGRWNAARYQKWKEFLVAQNRPCDDCGVDYPPFVMDFHHRDPAEKLFAITKGANKARSASEAEIAKCDLLCANCHRIREHSETYGS